MFYNPFYYLSTISHFFPSPNVHVPLGSTTETRTLDGSFATLPSVPSIGTGCIVTAVVDMAGSRVELTDRPSSRPATAFRARPCTRHPRGELALRGDRKKFQNVQVELRDYDSALRSARGKADPGGSGVQPLRCRSAAPARSASAKDAEHDCWRGHSRAPAHLLLLHAGSHAALGRAGAVAKAGGVPMGVSSPTGKKRRKQFAVGKNRDLVSMPRCPEIQFELLKTNLCQTTRIERLW